MNNAIVTKLSIFAIQRNRRSHLMGEERGGLKREMAFKDMHKRRFGFCD